MAMIGDFELTVDMFVERVKEAVLDWVNAHERVDVDDDDERRSFILKSLTQGWNVRMDIADIEIPLDETFLRCVHCGFIVKPENLKICKCPDFLPEWEEVESSASCDEKHAMQRLEQLSWDELVDVLDSHEVWMYGGGTYSQLVFGSWYVFSEVKEVADMFRHAVTGADLLDAAAHCNALYHNNGSILMDYVQLPYEVLQRLEEDHIGLIFSEEEILEYCK